MLIVRTFIEACIRVQRFAPLQNAISNGNNLSRSQQKQLKMVNRSLLLSAALLIYVYSLSGQSTEIAAVNFSAGEYSIKTEIMMPHLETSLRYTTRKTQRCLGRENVSSLFPLLNHTSFVGCTLVRKPLENEHENFDLICLNSEAATGSARIVIDEDMFRATLYVKMGGKNMKFSQRINGHRISACK